MNREFPDCVYLLGWLTDLLHVDPSLTRPYPASNVLSEMLGQIGFDTDDQKTRTFLRGPLLRIRTWLEMTNSGGTQRGYRPVMHFPAALRSASTTSSFNGSRFVCNKTDIGSLVSSLGLISRVTSVTYSPFWCMHMSYTEEGGLEMDGEAFGIGAFTLSYYTEGRTGLVREVRVLDNELSDPTGSVRGVYVTGESFPAVKGKYDLLILQVEFSELSGLVSIYDDARPRYSFDVLNRNTLEVVITVTSMPLTFVPGPAGSGLTLAQISVSDSGGDNIALSDAFDLTSPMISTMISSQVAATLFWIYRSIERHLRSEAADDVVTDARWLAQQRWEAVNEVPIFTVMSSNQLYAYLPKRSQLEELLNKIKRMAAPELLGPYLMIRDLLNLSALVPLQPLLELNLALGCLTVQNVETIYHTVAKGYSFKTALGAYAKVNMLPGALTLDNSMQNWWDDLRTEDKKEIEEALERFSSEGTNDASTLIDTIFAVDSEITRQQLLWLLYRHSFPELEINAVETAFANSNVGPPALEDEPGNEDDDDDEEESGADEDRKESLRD